MWNDAALLTPEEMGRADRITIAAGTSGMVLMRHAGRAVAEALRARFATARRVAVLAGPGNNGGDAFVCAQCLAESGLVVDVFTLADSGSATGAAAEPRAGWHGLCRPLAAFAPETFDVVIDGLFGAGLSRPLDGDAAEAAAKTRAAGIPVVAIDLPSGVSGLTGQVLGASFAAALTVTFFRAKPGHLLMPGRSLCGAVTVSDIGIDSAVLDEIGPRCFANGPALWQNCWRPPAADGHKFDRGHAVVFSGGATKTGAARLAATAALRAGAGLVTVFSPASALLVNAAHLTAVMLGRCEDEQDLARALEDRRLTTFVLGPAFGDHDKARIFSRLVLEAGRNLVLDADGLSAFASEPGSLYAAIANQGGRIVLTPHGGEFQRLFPDIAGDGTLAKQDKARAAAARSGAVVILKGADSVIAAPDGRAAINDNGTPWLATAGSGDVLAGLVAGLLAQGMPVFEAAAAAVWLHGRAGEIAGFGLIAEDLPLAAAKAMASVTWTTVVR